MMDGPHSARPYLSTHLAFTFLIALVACQACSRNADSSEGIVVVNAPAAGEIRRVLTHEGMEVVEGQPIAEITIASPAQSASTSEAGDRQTQAGITVQAAAAEIEAARAEVVRHEVEVQRLTTLVTANQAPQGDLDGARAQYERAQQRLQRAKTAAQQAQTGLLAARQPPPNSSNAAPGPVDQIAVVRASGNGIVSAFTMRPGERVEAGQPLATIRAR